MKALEQHGGSILIMDLQGALFFGTGERLADEIAGATEQETRSLILDLRRISEIDSTGARIILDIQADLLRKASRLGLVLSDHSGIKTRLEDLGMLERIAPDQIFEDVDRAVEWAEDNLLRDMLVKPVPTEEILSSRSASYAISTLAKWPLLRPVSPGSPTPKAE
jgi:MFS superfamily sulfate permease-like transporter